MAAKMLSAGDVIGSNGMGRWRVLNDPDEAKFTAWDFDQRPYPGAGELNWYVTGWHHKFLDPTVYDLSVHKLFCVGKVPSAVYADWVEENGILLPPRVMDLLRGW